MSAIQIHLPTAIPGGKKLVALDGIDITDSLVGIGFTARTGELNRAVLELHLPVAEINGEARVEVDAQQQALLLALGWTPPKGEALPIATSTGLVAALTAHAASVGWVVETNHRDIAGDTHAYDLYVWPAPAVTPATA